MKNSIFAVMFFLIAHSCFSQVSIIFDTDMGSDCDDAGALAVLHKLAEKGEATILGVIYSSGKIKEGVGVCDAINTWYNRPDLPIGHYKKDNVGDPVTTYLPQVGRDTARFGHDLIDDAPEMVETYKNLLRSEPDNSVTIVTVGHPHGLYYLMDDVEGMRLIHDKVNKWIAMAHTQEKPNTGWNFGRNGTAPYVGKILEKWPKQAIFSGIGRDIITGNRLLPDTPDDNPVKEIYALWNGAIEKGRHSWDQVAVLVAVRPELFTFETSGSLRQVEEDKTFWDKRINNPNHSRVALKEGSEELEFLIEVLMSEPPG